MTTGLDAERAEVDDALTVVVATEVGVLLLGSLLAWAIAGRVLAPVRELRDTARSIGETDLTRRIPVRGSDELAELARTFNAMLDRLEAAFASQRDFVNDAWHELRTPITIVRGHLELMGDDPAERQETVALVTDELDRMSRFVDDLLLLAKAGRTDFLDLETVPLDQLTDELLAKARALGGARLAARRARHGAPRRRPPAAHPGDDGARQNATQHTAPGDAIAIGTALARPTRGCGCATTGPGIPPRRAASASSSASRASGTAAAARRAPASAWRSCGRSPRRTAAASSSRAAPARARRSRSSSRSTRRSAS